jgi:ATP-binding cassette, subfamily C, bacterial CydC
MSHLRWAMGFGRHGRRRLVLAVLLGSLASAAAVGLTAVSAWLIARASQQPPVLYLMVAIVAVRAFGASRGVFRYMERLASHDASFRILGEIRAATVAQLERILPDGRPDGLTSGELMSRFVSDIDGLKDLWARVVVPAASSMVVGVAAVILVGVFTPPAAVVLGLSLVAAGVVAPALSQRAARGAGRRMAPARGEYREGLLEVLEGSTELAVYGGLDERLERLGAIDAALVDDEERMAGASGVAAAVALLAGGAAVIAGLAFGAAAVAAGTMSPINVAVVALVPLAVHEVLAGLVAATHRLPELEQAAARARDVFERSPAIAAPARPLPIPSGPLSVSIRSLTANWPEARAVLADLDLDLAPGVPTVVVGPSGAGKSTLASVLLRFLEPRSGSVRLVAAGGSIDITEADPDDVRATIGWLTQDAYVFDSTIEANLRLARPEATESELRRALAGAQLLALVEGLPDGLQTLVGEHGRRLSGGQRQRLALARVLLADRRVVVFDEPTEHLDDRVASELARDILAETIGKTVLILTHRPELFPGARQLRLEDGRLVQPEPALT